MTVEPIDIALICVGILAAGALLQIRQMLKRERRRQAEDDLKYQPLDDRGY